MLELKIRQEAVQLETGEDLIKIKYDTLKSGDEQFFQIK